MTPSNWWVVYEDYCLMNGIKKQGMTEDEVIRLKKMFDLPEAQASKSRKANGN